MHTGSHVRAGCHKACRRAAQRAARARGCLAASEASAHQHHHNSTTTTTTTHQLRPRPTRRHHPAATTMRTAHAAILALGREGRRIRAMECASAVRQLPKLQIYLVLCHGSALAQGPCPPAKLLASVACGSLSSERGFPRNGSVKRPDAASHYNLGTCPWSGFAHRVLAAGLCGAAPRARAAARNAPAPA